MTSGLARLLFVEMMIVPSGKLSILPLVIRRLSLVIGLIFFFLVRAQRRPI